MGYIIWKWHESLRNQYHTNPKGECDIDFSARVVSIFILHLNTSMYIEN